MPGRAAGPNGSNKRIQSKAMFYLFLETIPGFREPVHVYPIWLQYTQELISKPHFDQLVTTVC